MVVLGSASEVRLSHDVAAATAESLPQIARTTNVGTARSIVRAACAVKECSDM
jgi:hypothetical protein